MSHESLVCQKPCEHLLRCGHRCQQICGKDCVCNCPAFTGAYPDDEFKTTAVRIGVDRRGRGTLAGYPIHNLDKTSAAGSGKWASYDPRADDARARRNAPRKADDSLPLIDISNDSSSTGPRNGHTILQETFRPVTLNTDGERIVGERIVSTSSPEKQEDENASSGAHGGSENASRSAVMSHMSSDIGPVPNRDQVTAARDDMHVQGQASLAPGHSADTEGAENSPGRSSLANHVNYPSREDVLGSRGFSNDCSSRYDSSSILDEEIQDQPDYVTVRSYSPESILPEYPSGIRERNLRRAETHGVQDVPEELDDSEPLIEL